MRLVLVAIELIGLTQLDGRVAYVNPNAIVQLLEPRDDSAKHKQFTNDVNCVVGLANGKYVTVRETCAEIRKLFVKEPPP